jgi:hypothetical protein
MGQIKLRGMVYMLLIEDDFVDDDLLQVICFSGCSMGIPQDPSQSETEV